MPGQGNIASGTLLVIAGVWVMFQTLVGDLPGRILSLANVANPSEPADPTQLGDKGKELLPPGYDPFHSRAEA